MVNTREYTEGDTYAIGATSVRDRLHHVACQIDNCEDVFGAAEAFDRAVRPHEPILAPSGHDYRSLASLANLSGKCRAPTSDQGTKSEEIPHA